MKNTLVLLFILFGLNVFSQDTIFTFHSTVLAKVVEVNTSEIKYKRFDNQDGPMYIELRTQVKSIHYANGTVEEFAKIAPRTSSPSITPYSADNSADYFTNKYANENQLEMYGRGYRYKGNRMTEREFYIFLEKTHDPDINVYVNKAKDAKAKQYIGFGGIVLGIGTFYFLTKSLRYASYNNNGTASLNGKYLTYSGLCLIGGITCPILSGVYKNKRTAYNRKAIELYNQRF